MAVDLPPVAPGVASVVEAWPGRARDRLLVLRRLILETADATPGVGRITETLKWGEPAYLTGETGSGSTVRIGWKTDDPDCCRMYFNCRTSLVDTFRTRFPELTLEGNRAIVLPIDEPLPRQALKECVRAALTYHLARRKRA